MVMSAPDRGMARVVFSAAYGEDREE